MKDSNGQIIEAGDRIIYCNKKGGMCDVDVVDRNGVLWGEGPFTEYPLDSWLTALDFDYVEIIGKTADILKEQTTEIMDGIFTPPIESWPDEKVIGKDWLPF